MPAARTKSEIVATLERISEDVSQGLSLCSAAARQGVLRRELVCWVRLADEGSEPFYAWLVHLCKSDADTRSEYFAALKTMAHIDLAAVRDWRRARGAPSELERELFLLRKTGLTRQAKVDARRLEKRLAAE